MTKDENGIWSVTLGPLPPEIWSYNFRVQGVDVTDPSNPAIKPTPPGQAMSSFVEVPGDSSAFYDARPVPHGDVRMVLYESKPMGVSRWVWIYTPPGYDTFGLALPGTLPAARQRRSAERLGDEWPCQRHPRQPDCRSQGRADDRGDAPGACAAGRRRRSAGADSRGDRHVLGTLSHGTSSTR